MRPLNHSGLEIDLKLQMDLIEQLQRVATAWALDLLRKSFLFFSSHRHSKTATCLFLAQVFIRLIGKILDGFSVRAHTSWFAAVRTGYETPRFDMIMFSWYYM